MTIARAASLTTMTMLVLGGTALSAQRPGTPMHERDGAPGAMGPGMMMGGMMGQGMMDGMMGQGMMGSGMMQMMGQGMGMMATGGPGPIMLLRMRDALDLTDEQVGRLEGIRDEFAEGRQRHMTAAMSAHGEARRALQGEEPDFEAYETALNQASRHMVQGHVAMARAAAQAREVLTGEQRERLHEGMRMMQGMMGDQGAGAGMMHGRGGTPR